MNQDFDPSDLSEKEELLIQINTQLGHIRQLLMSMDTSEQPDAEPMYECVMCGDEVPESERRDHATGHNLPQDVPLDDEFSRIDNPQ